MKTWLQVTTEEAVADCTAFRCHADMTWSNQPGLDVTRHRETQPEINIQTHWPHIRSVATSQTSAIRQVKHTNVLLKL